MSLRVSLLLPVRPPSLASFLPFVLSLLLARPAASEPAHGAFPEPGVPQPPITEMDAWRDYGDAMAELGKKITWVEIAFPDLRLQTPARIGDGIDALVLSWPVHLVGFTTGRTDSAAGGSLFVEPAFPTNHLAARGLSGVRVWGAHAGFAAVLEGGGVAGTDGSGAFAGAGPAIGDRTGLIALVVRRYFVLGADRWDFTLDIRPSVTLAELLGG